MKYFHVQEENYDVIVGYRADDSYFSFAQDFLNGAISYRQLKESMTLGDLGMQVVLKSQRAFEQITFIDYTIAKNSEWYAKKQLRDTKARRRYFDMDRNRWQKGDIYMPQILDEEMTEYDLCLR